MPGSSRFWYGNNIQKPTRAELEEGHHHAELEHAHDAPLEGHAADGHQFDGRHDVHGDELSSDATGTDDEEPRERARVCPGPSSQSAS